MGSGADGFVSGTDLITCPDSSIITPSAVSSFRRIAGDFSSCVPFALLQARHHFQNNAHQNPSDFEENMCRATACEVLARIVVARLDLMEQYEVLSARFTIIESDGDESFPLSGTSTVGGLVSSTTAAF